MRIRRQLGKKAEITGSILIVTMLILATTVVLFTLLWKARNTFESTSDGSCASQVRAQSYSNKIYGRSNAPEITACQTRYLTLTSKEIDTNPKDVKTSEKQIEKVLAREMLRCWEEWGSGELDLFKEAGKYCHVCATVTMDENVTQAIPEINGFPPYLKDTKVVGNKTYWDQLNPKETGKNIEEEEALFKINNKLSTKETLTIIYWHQKDKASLNVIEAAGQDLGIDMTPERQAAVVGGAYRLVTDWILGGKFLKSAKLTWKTTKGASRALGLMSETGFTAGSLVENEIEATKIEGISYMYFRYAEDWHTVSTMFLISTPSDSFYAQNCNQAASTTTSP